MLEQGMQIQNDLGLVAGQTISKLQRNGTVSYTHLFERCIPQAKREGYLFIISLIARYSDAQDLYEKLEKDWARSLIHI